MTPFLSAMQFLTRLPVPDSGWEPGRLDRAARWFPAVGIVVGALAAIVWWLAALLWTNGIAVMMAMASATLVTGALHEDGLADTADGLGGGGTVERRLAIMRDSRIGSYGAVALFLAILLHYGALVSLSGFGAATMAAILIGAHALSRLAMVAVILALPYARDREDTRVPLAPDRSADALVALGATGALAIAPLCIVHGLGIAFAGCAGVALATLSIIALLRGKLGGWTGDTAGAAQQLTALAFLLGASAARWT